MKLAQSCPMRSILLVVVTVMISGCGSVDQDDIAFAYDEAEFPGAKP